MNPTFLTYAAVCFSCAAAITSNQDTPKALRAVRSLLMTCGGASVVAAYLIGGGA